MLRGNFKVQPGFLKMAAILKGTSNNENEEELVTLKKEKVLWQDKVRWDVVEKFTEQYGLGANVIHFGAPNVVDPTHTIFAQDDVDVQPKWDIPDKIIIATAITGSFYNKNGNPNHPIAMEEIYQSAKEVCKAGAPVIHLHVRNDEGFNTLDPERLKSVIFRLKDEFPEVIIDTCLVPGNAKNNQWDKFVEMLETGLIECTPVNTTTVYCGDELLCKYPHVMLAKAKKLREYGVRTRLAIYCDADIDNADRWLIKTGLVPTSKDGLPTYWGVLPALPGGTPMNSQQAMVEGFMNLRNRILEIDPKAIIQVCASGRASIYLATLAVLMGHHLRVGMEDTVWRWPHKDQKITSNAETFLQYKKLCEILGREVVTPKEYRQLLGIPMPK
jgi:3-keto-5-aminohexanoate cleavage enzyme